MDLEETRKEEIFLDIFFIIITIDFHVFFKCVFVIIIS